ncbi:Ger(x)C family spore germination protein [Bacillota bacterium Lsc_1132]
MKMQFPCFLVILLIIPILGGCWNQKELTDLAFVMGIGVDKGKNGQKFMGTFQIVVPANVSTGQNGGGQGLPIVVYKAEGKNLLETARNVTKKIPRRLYYAHTNLLVISEDLARAGVLDIFDILDRYPDIRATTQVIIAKNSTAEEMMSTLSNIDKLPVDKITKALKVTEEMLGDSMVVTIDDFINSLVSDGKEPIVSVFTLRGKKSARKTSENLSSTIPPLIVQSDGLAIFKKGKLKSLVRKENARGVLWILNKIKSTETNINWDKKKNAIGVSTTRAKTKVSASVKRGQPRIHISVKEEGVIEEADLPINLNDPEVIKKIEKKLSKKIKTEVFAAIHEAKKQKSDIFGFGEKLHRVDPVYWKKAKGNWDERFAQLPVTVEVQAYIRREGVRTLPFWSKMQK